MQKQKALQILAGLNGQTEQQASAPTNVHIISGETGAASEDGKVPVRIDGLVYGPDDSQYVEMDTLGGLEEGETTSILLTGDPGHGMVPLAIGTPGGVDRAAKTAKDYLTEYTTDNDEKGLFVHRKTDDLGSENGVKITEDIDVVRNGVSKLHIDEDSVDINDSEEENIARFVGATEEPSESNGYQTIRRASVEMGNSTLGTAKFNALLVDGQETETTYEYKGTSATIEASRDIGEPVDLIAKIVAQVVKEYNTSRSDFDVISTVKMQSDYLDVTTRTGYQIERADMDSIRHLIGCRIDIAFGTVTVPANGGKEIRLTFVNGGFIDSNYICSAIPMNWVAGFNNVAWCVASREPSVVTLLGWNNNSYDVTYNIGVIGADSRYGTTVI